MKKYQPIRLAGLTICTSSIIINSQSISDLSKGLLMGIGSGLLILSIILQLKRPKAL